MRGFARRSINSILNRFGMAVISANPRSETFILDRLAPLRRHLVHFHPEAHAFFEFCLPRIAQSRSQIMQDLFVLHILGERRDGYFVDFGATDGIELSNSFLLEKSYGWTGILSEPARQFREILPRNRNAVIDFDCVSDRTGASVMFDETPGMGLSTMAAFSDADCHGAERKNVESYAVTTVSLNDLLRRHSAPSSIDYLSIDTEGSELSILSAFDFKAYLPKVITVEHNYVENKRSDLFNLLTGNGYRRQLEALSLFDDWYVHESV